MGFHHSCHGFVWFHGKIKKEEANFMGNADCFQRKEKKKERGKISRGGCSSAAEI